MTENQRSHPCPTTAYPGAFNEATRKTLVRNIFPWIACLLISTPSFGQSFNYYAPDPQDLNKGSYNTFLGVGAGASNTTADSNTFIGFDSGNKNTEGANNTFIGAEAGENNTKGNANTFIGNMAGFANSSGGGNTFNGAYAGQKNETGYGNTFIGVSAGFSNTTGKTNTFNGLGAGFSNIEGEKNTFIGASAGYKNTKGIENTFVGVNAGLANDTGIFNSFFGVAAGLSNESGRLNTFGGVNSGLQNKTGSNNTFYGVNSGYKNKEGSNNVFLGYQAGFSETGSNKLYISNSDTKTPLIYGDFNEKSLSINGKFGVGTAKPDTDFEVASDRGFTEIYSTAYGKKALNIFGGAYFVGRRAQGTAAEPKAVEKDNNLALFGGRGYEGTVFSSSTAGIRIRAAEDWNDTSQGGYMTFYTTAKGNRTSGWRERMRITDDGKVGIGTARPDTDFEVASDDGNTAIYNTAYGSKPAKTFGGGYFIGRRAQGTAASPEAVRKDNSLALFSGRGHDGSGFSKSTAAIVIRAAEDWNTTSHGGYMTFKTTAKGKKASDWHERMRITDDGKVGIGTEDPQSKLAVNGRITAREVAVTVTGWPDFVFDEDYALMPLSALETHIQRNKHLPGLPSQRTVARKGIDLGQMNALLLQKIEELTLHTIRQQKEIDQLRKSVLAQN